MGTDAQRKPSMSSMGQTRRLRDVGPRSGLPPTADISGLGRSPNAPICRTTPAYDRCSRGNETLDLLCLSIASSSSSSDRVDIPSARNPGRFPEAVVSICMSST
jgi:hypothetical protein